MISGTLALALALVPTAAARGPQDERPLPASPTQIATPALREWAPPTPERRALPSGAELLVLRDAELPLVDGVLAFRAGSIHEDPARVGLVDVLCDALREGGSTGTPGPELDAWLDQRAARISIDGERDRISVRFSCLAEDLDPVLARVGELLREPAYPESSVANAKRRLASSIARRLDDAGALAGSTLLRVAYGWSSPWAREPDAETVAAIGRDDLLAFHRAHFGPDRLLVGLAGDVAPDAVEKRVQRELAELAPVGPVPAVEPPFFLAPDHTRLWLIDRPGVAQTELRLGAVGPTYGEPAYPAMYLWSNVVGTGGFTNRMMLRIRTELGLAYTVGALFRGDWERPGTFYGFCGTRNDQAHSALEQMLVLLVDGWATMIPTGELESARERLLAGEVFRIDTTPKVLDRAVDLAFHGYPLDFWSGVHDTIRELDAEKVGLTVARTFAPRALSVVAVGPAEEIERNLRGVVDVQRLSLDPGRVESTDEGRSAVERMLAALGGRERWAGLRSVELETVFHQGPSIDVETHQWYSTEENRFRHEQNVLGREIVLALTPGTAWQNDGVSIARLPYATHATFVRRQASFLYRLLHLLAADAPDLGASLDAEGRILLTDDLGPVAWIELREDKKPRRLSGVGLGAEVFDYIEWTETEGFGHPLQFRRAGVEATVDVKRFAPNPELTPEMFEMRPLGAPR